MQSLLYKPRRFVLSSSLPLLMTLFAAGCGLSGLDDESGRNHQSPGDALTGRAVVVSACDLARVADVVTLIATPDGIVLASAEADEASAASSLVATRYHGSGCALAPASSPLAAVTTLLDADDRGNLYAFPRATKMPGIVSSFPPGTISSSVRGMVVKIDAMGQASAVVEAGRGIWSFGVSPAGGTFVSTACGPTGIFAMDSQPLAAVMTPPQSAWESRGAVLTGDSTLWSLGDFRCSSKLPKGSGCTTPLFRSTPAGDEVVANVAIERGSDGDGKELFRCAHRICGMTASAIAIFGEDGAVVHAIPFSELAIDAGERIVQISGNQHGIYVLLRKADKSRLMFAPLRG